MVNPVMSRNVPSFSMLSTVPSMRRTVFSGDADVDGTSPVT